MVQKIRKRSGKKVADSSGPKNTGDESVAPVRIVEGEDELLAWLKQPGVMTWRYRLYKPGFLGLLFVALALLSVAALLAYRSGLALLVQQAAFLLLLGAASWALWIVGRWFFFRYRQYVALSDSELLVGRSRRAFLIPRERISSETLKLENMQKSRLTGCLPFQIDGQRVEIHLVGPFCNLTHLDVLMTSVLEDLKQNSPEPEAEAED